jgi:hypothetical protein
MRLISNDFEQDGSIPTKFTCDGEDISPHLKWEDIPDGTESFAISCNDPDAPVGDWIHWVVHDIPATITELSEGAEAPGNEVTNDFGKTEYGGPCPPGGTHRYFFRVYALDTESLEGVTKNNFRDKLTQHAIEEAELMGKYSR